MSKKNFKQECIEVIYDLMHSCYDELNLFCEIVGLPKNDHNDFIADDPHGVVDFQEGYMFFNMSDIHVVIAEYEHWLELYKTNDEIARVVREWYYYSLENYEGWKPCNLKSWLMGWRPDPKDVLPQYKEHQAKELTAAHARVEAAKEELRKAMEFMDSVSF